MTLQVTGFDVTGTINLEIGQEVLLVHDPSCAGFNIDKKIIEVLDPILNSKVGVIGSKPGSTVIEGTEPNTVLFDEMKKLDLADENGRMEIKGVVINGGKVTFRNGQKHSAVIIEVKLPEKETTLTNFVEFEFQVRGTVKENKGKTTVLSELRNGTYPLFLKKDGERLVTFIKNNDEEVQAGVVDKFNHGSAERLLAYMTVLEKRNESQNIVAIKANANSYIAKCLIDKTEFEDVLSGKVIKTLDEVRNEILTQGIVNESTLIEIESYLKDNKVPDKHIKKIYETYRVYDDDEVAARIPTPKVKYKDKVGLVKKSIIYLNKGKHLRFIGEKGVGKNVLIETLAWIYQRPLYEMALNSQTDKMDILGSKTFETELDENGKEVTKMTFDKEVLVQAMEVGGFMNLDEINTADPSVLVVLHPIADGRGRLEVPGYGRVEADSNFALILSMNQDYLGTQPLNEATRDRFIPILFPNNTSIADMLRVRVPDANPKHISIVDRVYGGIMKLVQNSELSNDCITNRGFIDTLEVSEDLGLKDALVDNIANRIEDKEYRDSVLQIIDNIVG